MTKKKEPVDMKELGNSLIVAGVMAIVLDSIFKDNDPKPRLKKFRKVVRAGRYVLT